MTSPTDPTNKEGARVMATAEKTAPWQAQIISELETMTADDLGDNTHAIVWIRENGNADLLHIAEGENAATITAEDDATKVDGGEVKIVKLADLQEWIEGHVDELLPVAGSDDNDDQADDETETEEDADADDDLPIAGTATGPDPDSGQLFDVPRVTVDVDESDPNVLKLAFSGNIELDRSIPDDVKLYNRLKAGRTVSLEIDAHVAGSKKSHRRDNNGDVQAIVETKSLIVHSLEAA